MFNNQPLICTACGYIGKPQKTTKGNTLIELILWLFFLIPGLIYSIWRLSSKYDACPKCKGSSMIPTDSPIGQKVINEHKSSLGVDPIETYRTESKSENRRNLIIATIVIGFIVVMVTISALIGQKENTPVAVQVQQTPQPAFDIPSLIGKDIDEIRKTLGQPTSKNVEAPKDVLNKQKQLGGSYVMETWDNTFKAKGMEIGVEFFIKDRSVKSFFIGANDPSGATKDRQRLLAIGNLTENDPRYKVEFIKARIDPTSFTGVTILPTKKR